MAEPTLDENQIVYVVSSTKENFNLGKSSEKRFSWPIQMPAMWLTRGNDGTPYSTSALSPPPCGIGWPQSSDKLIGTDSASPTL